MEGGTMLLTQNAGIKTVRQPVADAYNTNPATATVNMKHYGHVTFLLMEGAGGTGTATLTIEECTAADGTGAAAIPFRYRVSTDAGVTFGALTSVAATGYTTVAGANKVVAVELDDSELAENSPFVRLKITEVVDSPVAAGVVAILTKPRNSRAVMI
jgi:hypothetical protein